MKKQIRKMSLNGETLRALETPDLRVIAGGAATLPPVCEHTNAINC